MKAREPQHHYFLESPQRKVMQLQPLDLYLLDKLMLENFENKEEKVLWDAVRKEWLSWLEQETKARYNWEALHQDEESMKPQVLLLPTIRNPIQ